MSDNTVDREPEKKKVERELGYFRVWFSLLTFLLTAVAFVIGFPALEDAGRKIGLGSLSFGLPFAIDLGMVTLLLWSMWNRGMLKRWWPPLIPAGLLLALSSWLQYIHAVDLISSDTPELARFGLLVLAACLPLLLALSAGVFESVTFAPLIERAKRHTELLREQQIAEDQLWRIEVEQKRAQTELSAQIMRNRMELESRNELLLLEAEAKAASNALKATKTPRPNRPQALTQAKVAGEHKTNDGASERTEQSSHETPAEAMESALAAVRNGELSQRAAAEHYGVSRSGLRRLLEQSNSSKAVN